MNKALFSLFFILMDTEDLIIREFEKQSRQVDFEMDHRLKQEYNRLQRDIKVVQNRIASFEDILFKMTNYRQYDDIRADANFLARMNLLIFDRCRTSAKENLLENHLKKMESGGLFEKELIEKFRLK